MKYFKSIIAFLLCFSLLTLVGCVSKSPVEGETQDTTNGFSFPASLSGEVVVEECFPYSGKYLEDASFEPCENVAALKVKNNGEGDIQFLRVKVTTDKKEMLFELSTVPAGATVSALEKSKQILENNEEIKAVTVENRADFANSISLQKDTLLVKGNIGTINIQNISQKDITSEIYVYYKKVDADSNYLGGISFRTKVEGLKVGEIKQLPAEFFDPQDSVVVFVDYAE